MENGKIIKRANPSTIHDKFLVGYQGWFTCAGDGEPIDPGHHGWLHWFNCPIPDGGKPNVDIWPDISEYTSSELYPAPGIKTKSGEDAKLFSSRNPQTIQRHFHWMARHGIDGAFLQRFASQCDTERSSKGLLRLRDEIGDHVRSAAEKEGRVFAIMYDVSGVPPERVAQVLEKDWNHLVHEKRVLDSPYYLKEQGRPVIALWGFGFEKRNHTPDLVRHIVRTIRSITPGGAYVMAGTPTHWRTATGDADRNPDFLNVWLNDFDAISPWMVGRLRNNEDVENFADFTMKPDIQLLKKRHDEGNRKVDYIPVIYPGFSGLNLSEGRWGFNDIKRDGGRFLWKQIFSAKRLGLRTFYGAMWDEYDEGTAFMPVVEKARLLPDGGKFSFLALDADGYDIPSDWYMKICGFAAEGLRSERMIHETFPSKELQDYWSSRPRYEEKPVDDNEAGKSSMQAYQEWLGTQKDGKDEPPPPPYSLEAEEEAGPSTSAAGSSASASASSAPAATNSVPAVSVAPASHQSTVAPHSTPSSNEPDLWALSHDFSRQTLTSSPLPIGPIPSPGLSTSMSPPPVHPAHPSAIAAPRMSGSQSPALSSSVSPPPLHPSSSAASTGPLHPALRPQPNLASRPSTRPRPPEDSRPFSQQSNRPDAPPSSIGYPQGPHFPSPSSQPQTLDPQWPPPEWGTQQPSSSPYQRPTPSPQPPAQHDYRPPAVPATPPAASGPTGSQFAQSNNPHMPLFFPQPDVNQAGPSSYTPAMNSSFSSSPSPTFPPTGSPQSQYTPPPVSQGPHSPPLQRPPSQASHAPPTGPPPGHSQYGPPPQSPAPHASYSPYSQNSSSYGAQSSYPGSSLPSHSYSSQGGQTYSHYGSTENFPQPHGPPQSGISYYNPNPTSYPPDPNNNPNGGYWPSYQSQPQLPPRPPSQGPGPGSQNWTMPPNPPPRPPIQNQYSATSGPSGTSFPMASSSSSASSYTSYNPYSNQSSSSSGSSTSGIANYALNAVGKVAGRGTRDQLESLAQTSTKFLSKFK